jgi:hypothetical protein
MDFEKAIHKAVEETWPNIRTIGCRFHLAQAWYRKIQKCGVTNEYHDKSSERLKKRVAHAVAVLVS